MFTSFTVSASSVIVNSPDGIITPEYLFESNFDAKRFNHQEIILTWIANVDGARIVALHESHKTINLSTLAIS